MSLWGTLKKEGSFLGDISGVNTVVHAAEHPLNWKNDLKAALVIGSYALGPGMLARDAAGLAERLAASRVGEAAPAEVGSALHAAWGTPKVENPIKTILAKLGKGRPAGNGELAQSKGMFFSPVTRKPYGATEQHSIADKATQALEQQKGEYAAIDPEYGGGAAMAKGHMTFEEGQPPYAAARMQDSHPLMTVGEVGPNTRSIDAMKLKRLLADMGYNDTSVRGMHMSPVELMRAIAKRMAHEKKMLEDTMLEDGKIPAGMKAPAAIAGTAGYGALGYLLGKGIYDKVNH